MRATTLLLDVAKQLNGHGRHAEALEALQLATQMQAVQTAKGQAKRRLAIVRKVEDKAYGNLLAVAFVAFVLAILTNS